MKIKMLIGIAGPAFSLAPGDETDRFPAAEAKSLIEAGHAVPVAHDPVESAVKKPAPEKRDA